MAVPPSGLQEQQGLIHWDQLEQPEQEQRLLRQENERLQREVQSTKTDLAHSREKVTWAGELLEVTLQVLNVSRDSITLSGYFLSLKDNPGNSCPRFQSKVTKRFLMFLTFFFAISWLTVLSGLWGGWRERRSRYQSKYVRNTPELPREAVAAPWSLEMSKAKDLERPWDSGSCPCSWQGMEWDLRSFPT